MKIKQTQFLKGSREFEIDGDTLFVRIKSLFKEEKLTVEEVKKQPFIRLCDIFFRKEKQFLETGDIIIFKKSGKVFAIDFDDDAKREEARKEINGWVEKQTNKMIKDFIKPGVLTDATGMVLVNAVYFKALWETAFVKEETIQDKFLAASGKTLNVEMMNSMSNNKYYEDENLQAIEIPYKSDELTPLSPGKTQSSGKDGNAQTDPKLVIFSKANSGSSDVADSTQLALVPLHPATKRQN